MNAFQCDLTISWLNPLDELVPLFSFRYSNIAFCNYNSFVLHAAVHRLTNLMKFSL